MRVICNVGLLLATAMSAPAFSQETKAGDQPGEIVVTAQKREQKLQDIGLSISAIGGEQLAAMGRQDVTALAGQVPSLAVNQYSPTITVFNIRGVSQNDFADSQEAPIAFYNDEVYVSALGAISGQTFDLERVEVLRGPQGTLFGRNATGGLVQVVTKKPTRSFEAFATATVGSYNQIATEGAISGPFSDTIRGRLSFTTNRHDGYQKNEIGKDVGNSRFYALRGQIEADLSPQDTLLLKLQGLRNRKETSGGIYTHIAAGVDADGLGYALAPNEDFWGTCAGCDAFGYRDSDNDPHTGAMNRIPYFDRKYWSATLRYQHDFGGATLTSISDYQKLRKRFGEDSDVGPLNAINYDTRQNLYQLSEEIRLAGKADRLNWIVGVYGLKIRTDNDYQLDGSDILGFIENYGGRQTTESIAVFGQVEYVVLPKLTAILGGRYSWDWKRFNFTHAENGVTDLVFNPTTYPDLAKQTYKNWSGKAQLEYRPAGDTLIYVGVNRGTKSGGFGVQAFPPIDPQSLPYGQEVLTNYEAGVKLSLLNRAITLGAAGFYYDYKGYQAFSLKGLSQFVTNQPATVKGFEVELGLRPYRGLLLNIFASHLDAKVKDITLPAGRVTDREMPQAPSWSVGGLLRYEMDVLGGSLSAQTDWKYGSAQYFSTFNAPVDYEKGRIYGNVRLSYTTGDRHWTGAFFVNNVTDKDYRLYNLDVSSAGGIDQATYARPRWFGGSLTYTY